MTNEPLFTFALATVLSGWVLLLAAYLGPGSAPWRSRLIDLAGLWIPLFLGITHAVMLATLLVLDQDRGSLFSLAGIITKFSDPDHLFLLYLEGMLFSLFIGRWIVLDASLWQTSKILVVPLLLMQSLLGPPALALWLGLRPRRARR